MGGPRHCAGQRPRVWPRRDTAFRETEGFEIPAMTSVLFNYVNKLRICGLIFFANVKHTAKQITILPKPKFKSLEFSICFSSRETDARWTLPFQHGHWLVVERRTVVSTATFCSDYTDAREREGLRSVYPSSRPADLPPNEPEGVRYQCRDIQMQRWFVRQLFIETLHEWTVQLV